MMFMEVKVRWRDEWMEMLFWNSKYDTNVHMLFIFPHSHAGQEPYIHPAPCGDPALPFCGLQYGWVQVSLPWIHADAQTLSTALPPRIPLLPLQGCPPESWHGPLSASCASPACSSSALIHPPARDRLLWAGLCNKQNVHCIRKAFLRSAFSSALFIFIQQQKQMFCGVFASPDVPLKALSAVQSRCWFLENRKSCGS